MDVGSPLVGDGEATELGRTTPACARRPTCDVPAAGCLDPPAPAMRGGCGGGLAPDDSGGGRRPCRHAASKDACAAVPSRSGSAGRHPRPPPAFGCHGRSPPSASGRGDALRVGDDVALRAPACPDRSGSARRWAPLLAAIEALSRGRSTEVDCRSGDRAGRAARAADGPTLRPSANPPQAPPAGHPRTAAHLPGQQLPRACPSAARTGSPSVPRGSEVRGRPPFGLARQAAAAVRSRPTGHREGAVSPSTTQRAKPGFVRGSKYR